MGCQRKNKTTSFAVERQERYTEHGQLLLNCNQPTTTTTTTTTTRQTRPSEEKHNRLMARDRNKKERNDYYYYYRGKSRPQRTGNLNFHG
jgi:broad specificity polyphosphatase/5'/3'-nucleotidase SurE